MLTTVQFSTKLSNYSAIFSTEEHDTHTKNQQLYNAKSVEQSNNVDHAN